MIPADHWHDNDDGTAWWVWDGNGTAHPPAYLDVLDRPCDTCADIDVRGGTPRRDPGCINGRHAFDVEVECGVAMCRNGNPGYWEDGGKCGYCDGSTIQSRRVSVVPGMVLPIVHHLDWLSDLRCVEFDKDGDYQLWDGRGNPTPATLPPAARPGMWAVKLRVAS